MEQKSMSERTMVSAIAVAVLLHIATKTFILFVVAVVLGAKQIPPVIFLGLGLVWDIIVSDFEKLAFKHEAGVVTTAITAKAHHIAWGLSAGLMILILVLNS